MMSLLLFGCGAKAIPPSDMRILNPFKYGCSCTDIPDEQLNHMQLVGDGWMDRTLRDLKMCVDQGWIEENQ